ncbi:hypothetical protein ABT061_23300 [Streptosporangium sp. NPDC002544]|uniref:hypothetical protein n=1 Tax=Streptosporangium sp. NPDC002544 TaxID=3154538 RepID=UPI003330AFFD
MTCTRGDLRALIPLLGIIIAAAASACASDVRRPPTESASTGPTPGPTLAPTRIGPQPGTLRKDLPCPVTRPADRPAPPPPEAIRWNSGNDGLYGGGGLWVALPTSDSRAVRWPDGKHHLKMGWWRAFDGRLKLGATSLRTGETVTEELSSGYGTRGFQASTVGFPHPGCWLVTGSLGATEVNFVVDVKFES